MKDNCKKKFKDKKIIKDNIIKNHEKIIGWPYKTLNKNQTRQIQILKNKKKLF